LVCYSAFSSLFLKAYITLLNLVHLLLFAARSICFYVFGLYLVSLLCYQYPFHIIILSCVFLFFIFDECLIFSLIDSIIFPITNMWFEPMEVCATHILSPIVSYGLNRWRYIFVFCLFFFFFFCGYRSSLKFLTNEFQQTENYALLAFYFYYL